MKILLDTHALIWFLQGNDFLGEKNKSVLEDPENEKYLSIASIWEMVLKINSKKLEISKPIQFYIPKDIVLINIQLLHIYHLEELPFHHKVPFDRLIISTSLIEKLTIIER